MSTEERNPSSSRGPELPELARPLAQLMDERFRGLDGHPEPERLLAYASGELSFSKTEEMREHLSVCGDCLDWLLLRPDVPSGDQDELETFAAWREMRARIREHELRGKLERRTRALRWFQIAAAVLLVLVPGMVWMSARQAVPGAEPAVNAAIFDVRQSQVRGFGVNPVGPQAPPARPAPHESPTGITVPAGSDSFVLVFWLDARDFDAYGMVLLDEDGDEIWRTRELQVDLGTATLGLSRQSMEPGRYHVEIYGIEDDGQTRIGEYFISLSYS